MSISDLALLVSRTVGFEGEIVRDMSKPDGTSRKLMSADRLRGLAWTPTISPGDGLCAVYDSVKDQLGSAQVRMTSAA